MWRSTAHVARRTQERGRREGRSSRRERGSLWCIYTTGSGSPGFAFLLPSRNLGGREATEPSRRMQRDLLNRRKLLPIYSTKNKQERERTSTRERPTHTERLSPLCIHTECGNGGLSAVEDTEDMEGTPLPSSLREEKKLATDTSDLWSGSGKKEKDADQAQQERRRRRRQKTLRHLGCLSTTTVSVWSVHTLCPRMRVHLSRSVGEDGGSPRRSSRALSSSGGCPYIRPNGLVSLHYRRTERGGGSPPSSVG